MLLGRRHAGLAPCDAKATPSGRAVHVEWAALQPLRAKGRTRQLQGPLLPSDHCRTEARCYLAVVDVGEDRWLVPGAAEFGLRALGNRSLLAWPWASYVKENLNDYIKHREWFRPFAVAVAEEDCERYF